MAGTYRFNNYIGGGVYTEVISSSNDITEYYKQLNVGVLLRVYPLRYSSEKLINPYISGRYNRSFYEIKSNENNYAQYTNNANFSELPALIGANVRVFKKLSFYAELGIDLTTLDYLNTNYPVFTGLRYNF